MDDFLWLQNWYRNHCNKDWEHGTGICIRTIDNPGWALTINLLDTELEHANFTEIESNRTNDDWIFCTVKNSKFEGRCGVINLPEILRLFRIWTENEPFRNRPPSGLM